MSPKQKLCKYIRKSYKRLNCKTIAQVSAQVMHINSYTAHSECEYIVKYFRDQIKSSVTGTETIDMISEYIKQTQKEYNKLLNKTIRQ